MSNRKTSKHSVVISDQCIYTVQTYYKSTRSTVEVQEELLHL